MPKREIFILTLQPILFECLWLFLVFYVLLHEDESL